MIRVREGEFYAAAARALFGRELLIATHRNADPDAVASSVAMYFTLEAMGLRVKGIYLPEGMNAASKRVLAELNLDLKQIVRDRATCEDVGGLVVVDSSSTSQIGEAARCLEDRDVLLVLVDHHGRGDLVERANLAMWDPRSPSAAEMIVVAMKSSGLEVTKEVATLLLSGIVYDSRRFAHAVPRTFEAALHLLARYHADYEVALKAMHAQQPEFSERVARLKAAQRLKLYRAGDLLVAVTHVSAFEASAARSILELGADMAIVVSEGDGGRVVVRAREDTVRRLGIHVGEDLLKTLGAKLGGSGGGHAAAGAASIGVDKETAILYAVTLIEELIRRKTGLKLEPVM